MAKRDKIAFVTHKDFMWKVAGIGARCVLRARPNLGSEEVFVFNNSDLDSGLDSSSDQTAQCIGWSESEGLVGAWDRANPRAGTIVVQGYNKTMQSLELTGSSPTGRDKYDQDNYRDDGFTEDDRYTRGTSGREEEGYGMAKEYGKDVGMDKDGGLVYYGYIQSSSNYSSCTQLLLPLALEVYSGGKVFMVNC